MFKKMWGTLQYWRQKESFRQVGPGITKQNTGVRAVSITKERGAKDCTWLGEAGKASRRKALPVSINSISKAREGRGDRKEDIWGNTLSEDMVAEPLGACSRKFSLTGTQPGAGPGWDSHWRTSLVWRGREGLYSPRQWEATESSVQGSQ